MIGQVEIEKYNDDLEKALNDEYDQEISLFEILMEIRWIHHRVDVDATPDQFLSYIYENEFVDNSTIRQFLPLYRIMGTFFKIKNYRLNF